MSLISDSETAKDEVTDPARRVFCDVTPLLLLPSHNVQKNCLILQQSFICPPQHENQFRFHKAISVRISTTTLSITKLLIWKFDSPKTTQSIYSWVMTSLALVTIAWPKKNSSYVFVHIYRQIVTTVILDYRGCCVVLFPVFLLFMVDSFY